MRKNYKKWICQFMIVAILFTILSSTALALSPDKNQKCSLTVHKYSRITDTTLSNPTGEVLSGSATAGLGTPLNGAGFTLYKLTMPTLNSGETYTGEYTVATNNSSVTFTTNTGTAVATATIVGSEKLTQNGGIAAFNDLDHNQYLLVESRTPVGYATSPKTVISMPITSADGNGFNYDIHVYPKNISDLPITKTLDEPNATYSVGSSVGFTIDVAFKNTEVAPDDVYSATDLRNGADYGTMRVLDDLCAGLDYTTSTMVLMKSDGTIETLTDGIDYNLSGVVSKAGDSLVWQLTHAGIDKAISANAIGVQIKVKTKVVISNGDISNKAGSYVKKAGTTKEPSIPETPDVNVPTGAVILDKINGADNAKLSGAQFAITTDAAGTQFLKPDGTTKTITNHETLITDTDIIKGTTDSNGAMVFSGLEYDINSGSKYYLVEYKAPTGFQLKESSILANMVSGNTDSHVQVSVEVKNYANGTTDPDNPKFTLPLTGSVGTILLVTAGILLIVAATLILVLYRKKKRKGNDNEHNKTIG